MLPKVFCVALLASVVAVPLTDDKQSLDTSGNIAAVRHWSFRGVDHVGTLFTNQPTICDDVNQYSGYFSLDSSNKKYFYWFFESRSEPSSDPLLMWLTGGPGCSSVLALFAENGPCSVNEDGATTTRNPYSWNSNSNLLYVDQPPGTGFSMGSYDHNEDEVAEDMYHFLQAFFGSFKQYNTSFFVFGESYAGHYVPAISHRVWAGNQAKEAPYIPLTGVSVGNGLTDPQVQYAYYADMAYNSGTAPQVINKTLYGIMKAATPLCVGAIAACQGSDAACDAAFILCNEALVTPVQLTGINLYDMRIPCEYGNLCYNFTAIEAFLNRAEVQKEIGVSRKWESCNMIVNQLFRGDWMHNFQTKFPDMLASGIRVLIYAGDVDFICNWLGNKAWTMKLEWSGQSEYVKASDNAWLVNTKEAGKIRTAENFAFLQVYQAGHMVPMDQPEVALAMVNRFLNNTLV